MVDMFPFPSLTSPLPEKQIQEIVTYLVQFKEILEFALANITVDNLSQDLINTLNTLGADIEKSNENYDEHLTQLSNNALTISDVINTIAKITFSVNFETGKLEYATSL